MKAKILGVLFIAMLLLSISCTGSGETTTSGATGIPEPPSPEELAAQDFILPELPRITNEQLKKLMDDGEPLLVVDTRIQFIFNLGHLPETINISMEPEAAQATRFLTLPKDRKIIFYCD